MDIHLTFLLISCDIGKIGKIKLMEIKLIAQGNVNNYDKNRHLDCFSKAAVCLSYLTLMSCGRAQSFLTDPCTLKVIEKQ